MLRVTLEGAWLLSALPVAEPGLAQLISQAMTRGAITPTRPALRVQIDGQALQALDTAGALAVLRLIGQSVQIVELTLVGMQDHHARVLTLVQQRLPQLEEAIHAHAQGWRARLGASALGLWLMLKGHLAFFGRVAEAAWRTAREPRTLRTRELVTQLGNTGVSAIPVVAWGTGAEGIFGRDFSRVRVVAADGTICRASLDAPAIPNSQVPALLGLDSLRKSNGNHRLEQITTSHVRS
jgi:anti-anti-sigma regulatory factor